MGKIKLPVQQDKIAIIGMAGRFPEASDLTKFWNNLINGVESIRFFTPSELQKHGVFFQDANFIPAKGYLEQAEWFDADFFNFSPHKAKILDPQFRLLYEAVWDAWENAGYNIKKYDGVVGIYTASSSYDSYWQKNLLRNSQFNDYSNSYEILISNAKDFLATQIAYQFNFTGPCLNIQTACSSSLVAICKACDDLLSKKCDIAVVGAMSITFPLKNGYIYKEGMIYSKDGHCRAFAHDASGMVSGNGGGVVLLKRLTQAELDGDQVFATINGYAINNDGRDKLSYTAPSIKGQYEVLVAAARSAGIEPNTINYIEAHGSGTPLGDQIEVAALKQYIPLNDQSRENSCYLGSVKSNIGHLDVAAGIAGFIKVALALYHKKIPKTLHAEIAHPKLKLQDSVFRIVNNTIDWPATNEGLRRAGVSSFGVGGTNAHVILEEFNKQIKNSEEKNSAQWQILPFSAKTDESLLEKKDQLAIFIHNNAQYTLADIAYTLQNGRVDFPNRIAIVCLNKEEAFNTLYLPDSTSLFKDGQFESPPKCVFLFSGSLLVKDSFELLNELYVHIECFRMNVNLILKIVNDTLGMQLIGFFQNITSKSFFVQPSLEKDLITFIAEYALAKCWLFWGIKPKKIIGYGMGEYVAACFAEVFSIAEAVKLLALRFQIYINSHEKKIALLISKGNLREICHGLPYHLVAINAPQNCHIAVDTNSVQSLEDRLVGKGIDYQQLNDMIVTKISPKLLCQWRELVESINFAQPVFPITVSSHREDSLASIAEKNYWINKISAPIYYYSAVSALISQKFNVFIEIGYSEQLCRWIQQINNFNFKQKLIVVPGLLMKQEVKKTLAVSLAKIWTAGVDLDWKAWNSTMPRQNQQKISLPSYPFIRQQYLVEAQLNAMLEVDPASMHVHEQNYGLYLPKWKEIEPSDLKENVTGTFICVDHNVAIMQKLILKISNKFHCLQIPLMPKVDSGTTVKTKRWISTRAKLWKKNILSLPANATINIIMVVHTNEYESFYDLVALAKSLVEIDQSISIRLHVITEGIAKISHTDSINPLSTLVLGPIFCLPLERPNLTARCIDINLKEASQQVEFVLKELEKQDSCRLLALRMGKRYNREVLPLYDKNTAVPAEKNIISNQFSPIQFKKNGVYLITGGLGGIGLAIAKYFAKSFHANLILISRIALPEENKWLELLTNRGISISLASQLQALIEIKKHANQILTFSADVSDEMKMSRIIAKIKQRFGNINGVIHAASPMPEGILQNKRIDQIEEMFDAKIRGLNVLYKIFAHEQLDFMLLFSSLNIFYGSAGAADYISANAYLSAFSLRHSSYYYPLIAIEWDTWKDVGMRYNYLSREEFNEFSAYALGYGKWYPFLIEHKLDEKIVLLGALSIEISLMEFYKKFHKDSVAVLQEVSFLSLGIVCSLENFQLLARMNDNNEIELKSRDMDIGKTIFRATLAAKNKCIPSVFELRDILSQFEHIEISLTNNAQYTKNGRINVGAHWNCIDWVKQTGLKYLAKIVLPENFRQELRDFVLHPTLLDVAYSFNIQFMDKLHLPFFIEEIIVFHSLPYSFYSFIETKSINEDAGTCTSDVILFDEKGTVLLTVKGFMLKRVVVNNIEDSFRKQLTNDNVEGISQAEGVTALKQITLYPHQEVIVAKSKSLDKDIKALQIQKNSLLELAQNTKSKLETVESLPNRIKNIWIKLLGVEAVSPQDDFFDLNGDSLLAIEVCYLIKVDTDIHIAPNVLLEHPIFSDFVLAVSRFVSVANNTS